MATEKSMHKAALAWCTFETEDIEMDIRLAEAFADILDEYEGIDMKVLENGKPALHI